MHAFAAAGAVLLLASCSVQPNDLRDNRYYRPPSPEAAPAEPPPKAAPSVTSTPNAPTTTTSAPKPPELDKFALTAADLAAEGVQQTGTVVRSALTSLADCAVPLDEAEAGYQTTWTYPTGSTVRQYVMRYADPAEDVVRTAAGKLTCNKISAPVTAPDGQVTWCAPAARPAACTVVEPDGDLLSVVVVTASTEAKAKQAVTRIAPLAATALARNS